MENLKQNAVSNKEFVRVSWRKMFPGEEAFKMHDEQGIPLEYTAMIADERGFVIDWLGFIRRAKETGNFNIKRLLKRIVYACRDAGYNKEWFEQRVAEDPENFHWITESETEKGKQFTVNG